MSDPAAAKPQAQPEAEPDPVVRAYLEGVDRTLLAKNRALTPEQRLRQLMALQQLAAELQRAGREMQTR